MHVVFFFLDCELGDLKDVTDELKEDKNTQSDTLKQAGGQYIVNSPSPSRNINYT